MKAEYEAWKKPHDEAWAAAKTKEERLEAYIGMRKSLYGENDPIGNHVIKITREQDLSEKDIKDKFNYFMVGESGYNEWVAENAVSWFNQKKAEPSKTPKTLVEKLANVISALTSKLFVYLSKSDRKPADSVEAFFDKLYADQKEASAEPEFEAAQEAEKSVEKLMYKGVDLLADPTEIDDQIAAFENDIQQLTEYLDQGCIK
jgi:hypothetical protein